MSDSLGMSDDELWGWVVSLDFLSTKAKLEALGMDERDAIARMDARTIRELRSKYGPGHFHMPEPSPWV